MTLQDFTQTLNQSLLNSASVSVEILTPLIFCVGIFIVGVVIASLMVFALNELFKILQVEKTLRGLKDYESLGKQNPDLVLTVVVSKIVWWLILFAFLIAGLQIAGFSGSNRVLSEFANFVPNLIETSLLFIVGILFAYFVVLLIESLGNLSQFPATHLISKLIAVIILTFTLFKSFQTLGVRCDIQTYLIIGGIAAISLSFSLGCKDLFADMIKKLRKQ